MTTIGALAKQAGVTVETLRFYEREGLLPKVPRNRSGYRAYDEDAELRLRFIRRAQDLGFTLSEIRELIELQTDPSNDCADVCHAATAKLSAVDQKLAALTRVRNELARLIDSCTAQELSRCAIMECLADPAFAKPGGTR